MLDSFYFLLAAFGGVTIGIALGIFGVHQHCVQRIIKCQSEISNVINKLKQTKTI